MVTCPIGLMRAYPVFSCLNPGLTNPNLPVLACVRGRFGVQEEYEYVFLSLSIHSNR